MVRERELLLLRHAKSAWDSAAASDFERPLNGRGRRDAPRLGHWIKQAGVVPDRVVSSDAKRARQTVHAVVDVLGIDRGAIDFQHRVYLADPATLRTVLADCPATAQRLLLVGHNPGLESLLGWLVGEALELPPDRKLLPTATLARLRMPGDWGALAPGCAGLVSLVRPRELG